MPPPEDPCDPACVKIIIDTGMGRLAAKLYAGVLARKEPKTGYNIQPIDIEAALFYAGVVDTVREAALVENRRHLNSERQVLLMEQIDKECYRADYLIGWAQIANPTAEALALWTAKLFEWAKDDQSFYTAFAAESP